MSVDLKAVAENKIRWLRQQAEVARENKRTVSVMPGDLDHIASLLELLLLHAVPDKNAGTQEDI